MRLDRGRLEASSIESDSSQSADRCATLWKAVVIQALRDSFNFDMPSIWWLVYDDKDAPLVFEYAGFDCAYVRPRIKTVIVMMALALARGREPKFNAKTRRITCRSPLPIRRIKAQSFLKSSEGIWMRKTCSVPTDPFEAEKLLVRTMLLAHGSDEDHDDTADAA